MRLLRLYRLGMQLCIRRTNRDPMHHFRCNGLCAISCLGAVDRLSQQSLEGLPRPLYQENPSVRFGGATAQSADDWAARFGPYSREHVSGEGGSVSTRPRKGAPHWTAHLHNIAATLLMC